MAVEIFISWSGVQSRGLARALHDWIPLIVPGTHVFISEEDIGPGTRWSRALAEKLDSTDFGVFVVTPSNLKSRWLNFEAGAIAKRLERARVIPLLFGVPHASLTGSPLAEFQALEWSQADTLKLMRAINDATGTSVDPTNLSTLVARLWPDLAREVAAIPGPVTQATPLRFLLGDVGHGDPVQLVLPKFTFTQERIDKFVQQRTANLGPEVRKALLQVLDDDALSYLFGKPGQRKGGEGIDDIRSFAMNDLRALLTVSRALEREGARFQLVLDEDLSRELGPSPLVSFGMTTNHVTRLFLESSRLTGGTPLFAQEEPAPGEEFVRLANGSKYEYAGDKYGLIACVTPPTGDTTSKWLICAGLGVTGTEAAAHYLCNKAQSLTRTVGARDFVKVVTTKTGMPNVYHSHDRDTVFDDGSSPSD